MLPETLNAEYIESQYAAWKDDPESVSRDWQYFFKGFDVAASGGVAGAVRSDKGMPSRQAHVERLIYGYRHLGHIHLVMGDRKRAIRAFELGLKCNSTYEPILETLKEIGTRRTPVVPFLSRDHALNIKFGKTFKRFGIR